MRIAHLLGHADFGGAERQCVNLLNALAHVGPMLVLTDGSRSHGLLDQLDSRVRVRHSPCRLSTLPRDAIRLASILRRESVDVLHSHMFWPNLQGAMAVTMARTPAFVTSEHGMNPWKHAGHRWLERNLISRVAGARICVSQDIRDVRAGLDGIPSEKLIVIPNGTRILSEPRRPSRPSGAILAVGRLIEAKDYPNLLDAAALLQARGVRFRLRIAGDGPLRGELVSLAAAKGVADRVEWLGNRDDVGDLMRDSDVFVISSMREGQPMVVLEAMMAGMPIVATRVGGIPATLSHGIDSELVPPGDATQLAASIARLLDDAPLAATLGKAAHRRAVTQFSIDAVAAEHLRLYERLLAARRPPASPKETR
jgi:glycosyltransferase involved in cell wall biosynthesis